MFIEGKVWITSLCFKKQPYYYAMGMSGYFECVGACAVLEDKNAATRR